jgi:hypothetical protein
MQILLPEDPCGIKAWRLWLAECSNYISFWLTVGFALKWALILSYSWDLKKVSPSHRGMNSLEGKLAS